MDGHNLTRFIFPAVDRFLSTYCNFLIHTNILALWEQTYKTQGGITFGSIPNKTRDETVKTKKNSLNLN